MKKIAIIKKDEGDKLTVTVKLAKRQYAREAPDSFSNSDMLEYLKQEGYLLEEYENEEMPRSELTSYDTKARDPILEGTWVFKKKKKSLNKDKSQSYNKSKTKNNTGD